LTNVLASVPSYIYDVTSSSYVDGLALLP